MMQSILIEYDEINMLNKRIKKLENEGWQVQGFATTEHRNYMRVVTTVWLTRWERGYIAHKKSPPWSEWQTTEWEKKRGE